MHKQTAMQSGDFLVRQRICIIEQIVAFQSLKIKFSRFGSRLNHNLFRNKRKFVLKTAGKYRKTRDGNFNPSHLLIRVLIKLCFSLVNFSRMPPSYLSGFCFRALHMKEHPDYKYRPRRKPKSLMKKEPKFGFSLSPLLSSGMESLHGISRSLLPPLPVPPPGPHPPPHPLLTGDSDLKFPRSLFPPFPYPLYPLHHAAKLHAEDLASTSGGGKTAADLAFQALYGSSLYSQAAAAAAAASWPGGPCMVPCSCGPTTVPPTASDPAQSSPTPDPGIKRPVAYLLVKPEDHYAGSAALSPHII